MKKPPCDYIVWHLLPSIRKEFAKNLHQNYDLNQKQIATLLGLTPAAVCQYLAERRGDIEINDGKILKEIDKAARSISENGPSIVVPGTCKICNFIQSKKVLENLNSNTEVIKK